jgi:hypothetical protein
MVKLKAWERAGGKKGKLSRRIEIREEKPRILIVCEGEKTEPNYFRGFRLTNVRLEIDPAKSQHYSVVQHTLTILNEDDDYEDVWCVFDRDKHHPNPADLALFNSAIELARNNNINVAYSNDAFELWYLLHFNFYDMQLSRADYIVKLKELLPDGYKKNDKNMYSKLEDKMSVAIKNAKKLYDASDKHDPGNSDPSTTVFKLVEKLKKLG